MLCQLALPLPLNILSTLAKFLQKISRIVNIDKLSTISAVSTQVLETFVSVAEEFYRGLFDRMNQLEFLCRQEVQVNTRILKSTFFSKSCLSNC